MAVDITQAFFDAMAADSGLVALLSTFQGQPAIFTGRTVPPDADRPYIHTHGEVSQVPDETKDIAGRDIMRDVWVVADDEGSAGEIEAIGERVRAVFHRKDIGIGATQWMTMAMGPMAAPTDDKSQLQARIVSVRARFYE